MASLNRRATCVNAIRRIKAQCDADMFNEITLLAAEEKLAVLEQHNGRFIDEHFELVGEAADDAAMAANNALMEEVEDLVSQCRIALRAKIAALRPVDEPPAPQPAAEPLRVEVATDKNSWGYFDGNFVNWHSFRDRFTAAVHDNPAIKPVFKLNHLMNSVKGKAAQVVGTRQPTEENYKLTWDRLKEVYDDAYMIIQAHLEELFSIPALVHASYDGLRKLIDTTLETTRQLQALELPVEHWDQILVYMMVKRLDKATARDWEMQRGTELPKLTELCNFLEKTARSVARSQPEAANPGANVKRSRNGDKLKSSHSRDNTPNSAGGGGASANRNGNQSSACRVCRADHALWKCPEFMALSLQGRKDLIEKWKMCANCLRAYHPAKDCKHGICLRCPGKDKKHNSILCPTREANVRTALVTLDNRAEQNGAKQFKLDNKPNSN